MKCNIAQAKPIPTPRGRIRRGGGKEHSMSEEKQIEEMATILSENCGCCDNCEYRGILNDGIDCTEYKYADMLYNRRRTEGGG